MKMQQINSLKEERECAIYLWRVLRSARERERLERCWDERERVERERERGCWKNEEETREEGRKMLLGWFCDAQNGGVSFKRNGIVSVKPNDRTSASHGRHAVWSCERTAGRLVHTDDSACTESQTTCRLGRTRTTVRLKRQTTCRLLPTLNDSAHKPNDTPFGRNAERPVVCFLIYFPSNFLFFFNSNQFSLNSTSKYTSKILSIPIKFNTPKYHNLF